jgi:hypothetical protein
VEPRRYVPSIYGFGALNIAVGMLVAVFRIQNKERVCIGTRVDALYAHFGRSILIGIRYPHQQGRFHARFGASTPSAKLPLGLQRGGLI